jgi:hypothetical protein
VICRCLPDENQENNSSLKRRARFNESLDTARLMREEAKQKLMRYRTSRRSGFGSSARGMGDATSAVDPKNASGNSVPGGGATSDGEAGSTVESLIAKRSSLTPAEVAKLSMLLASDSSESAWDDVECESASPYQPDGNSAVSALTTTTTTTPAITDLEVDPRMGSSKWRQESTSERRGVRGEEVKYDAARHRGGYSDASDDDDDDSQVEAQVSICWDTASGGPDGVGQEEQLSEAAAFGGFGGAMGWYGVPSSPLQTTGRLGAVTPHPEDMRTDAVAAALAGVKSLAVPSGEGSREESTEAAAGRVLHAGAAPSPYAREYYATDVKEVARILSSVDEMVTPPFLVSSGAAITPTTLSPTLSSFSGFGRRLLDGKGRTTVRSVASSSVYSTRGRSCSSPAFRNPTPPSHFRMRQPPEGRVVRSTAASATERASASRASGWASRNETAPPFHRSRVVASQLLRPVTAPVQPKHYDRRDQGITRAGYATPRGSHVAGEDDKFVTGQEERDEEAGTSTAGRYPFQTVDAHLTRHGFAPVAGRDAALSTYSCYSRRRYFSSPGPRWRDSQLSPTVSASVGARRRGVYAREAVSSPPTSPRPYSSSAARPPSTPQCFQVHQPHTPSIPHSPRPQLKGGKD